MLWALPQRITWTSKWKIYEESACRHCYKQDMDFTREGKIHEESAMGTATHYTDFEKSKMQGEFGEYITATFGCIWVQNVIPRQLEH